MPISASVFVVADDCSYPFVGPERLRSLASAGLFRHPLTADLQLEALLSGLGLEDLRRSDLTLTYVVDQERVLWVADRQSEHIACARGAPVLAAGEITLEISGRGFEVGAMSNQSTGYCPEASCWDVVDAVLREAGLEPPDGFDPSFAFGRCEACASIAIIKDDDWACVECGGQLGPVHG